MRKGAALTLLFLLLSAASALAAEPGVTVDPNSPAGKEYTLPLNAARGDLGGGGGAGGGAGGGGAGTSGGAGTAAAGPAAAFGIGVTPKHSGSGNSSAAAGGSGALPGAASLTIAQRKQVRALEEDAGSGMPFWIYLIVAAAVALAAAVGFRLSRLTPPTPPASS